MPQPKKNKTQKAIIKPEVHNKIQGITSIKTLPADGFRNMLYEAYDYLTGFRWHYLIVNASSFLLGIGVTGLCNWFSQKSKETYTSKQIYSENKWYIWLIIGSIIVLGVYFLITFLYKPKSKEKFLNKFENYDGLKVVTTEYILSTTPFTSADTARDGEKSPNG